MRLSVSFERHNQTFNYLKIQKHQLLWLDQALELHHSVDFTSTTCSKAKGMNVGEAHLYFGCRHPEKDYLYRTELENDERDGLISLHTAFLA